MDRLKAEAKLEESLQTLDSLVADAALIISELDITRKNIEKAFDISPASSRDLPEFDPRLTEEQLHAAARPDADIAAGQVLGLWGGKRK